MEFSNKTCQNNDGEGDDGVVHWWEREREREGERKRERVGVCVCVSVYVRMKKKRKNPMAGQEREGETF